VESSYKNGGEARDYRISSVGFGELKDAGALVFKGSDAVRSCLISDDLARVLHFTRSEIRRSCNPLVSSERPYGGLRQKLDLKTHAWPVRSKKPSPGITFHL
jgi:hypothetical protein